MKKKLSLLLIIALIVTLVLSSTSVALGASASLSVSGGGTYTKGSTVTVRYTYSGSSIGGGTSNITYDSSVLQYVSCSGGIAPSSASGVFAVQIGDGNDHTSMSVTLTFKAIGAGSTSVSVSTSDLIDYDGNTLNFPSSSTTVTVTNPAPTVSSNANLSSLYVSAGSLSPSFSPSVTSYTVYVDKSETVCLISADTQDSDATIDVTGSKDLIIGRNVRSVVVTAPSGKTKTYTITIYRGDDSSSGEDEPSKGEDQDDKDEEDKPKEDIKVEIGDVTYVIEENIKSEDVPDEFRLVVGKFEGNDIPLIKDNDLKYTLALLKNQETGDAKWFFYDEEKGTFSSTVVFSADEVLDYVKLSAIESPENEENIFDNNMIILFIVFGATLLILIGIVIALQAKIIKGKKKSAKAISKPEQSIEE